MRGLRPTKEDKGSNGRLGSTRHRLVQRTGGEKTGVGSLKTAGPVYNEYRGKTEETKVLEHVVAPVGDECY